MRFIDASVFVHAFLKPKRKLQPHEEEIKRKAKQIISRLTSHQEVAATTIIQLAEIANLLEAYLPLSEAHRIEETLLLSGFLKIHEITLPDLLEAIKAAKTYQIGLSDAIAYTIMKKHGIREIYSFDRDFDKIKTIARVTS